MTNTTAIGQQAEEATAAQLQARGYKIIGRNVRTRFYELDIIAVRANRLRFVEVKYRQNVDCGDGLESIGGDKIGRLTRAVQMWLAENPNYLEYEVSLDVASLTTAKNKKSMTIKYVSSITDFC